MRLKSNPRTLAKLRATRVFPKPGKSSRRMCPPANTDAIIISRSPRLPTTARSTSAITCLLKEETLEMSVTIYSGEEICRGEACLAPTIIYCLNSLLVIQGTQLHSLLHNPKESAAARSRIDLYLGNRKMIRADQSQDIVAAQTTAPNLSRQVEKIPSVDVHSRAAAKSGMQVYQVDWQSAI